jgi:hypothetical protein
MRLRGIAAEDVVLVNKRGRIFHALVAGQLPSGELRIQPLDRRISYRHAAAREIAGHWARQERPRPVGAPPSDGQLALGLEAD